MNEPSHAQIHYLRHEQIDKVKWDACLSSSDNPLIYATSLYLDHMCLHWDGLVLNDYKAIMPLPWKRKYGISYVYTPYYVVACGVFGRQITQSVLENFISAIPYKFKYVETDLNENNQFSDEVNQPALRYIKRTNTYLNLDVSYTDLYSDYSQLAKRKIKKAIRENFQLREGTTKEVIELYKQMYDGKHDVLSRYDYRRMISFFSTELAANVKTYVVTSATGEDCAFYLLLYDEHYVYWLIGGSNEEARAKGVFYFLKDAVIKQFAGTKRTFRFEGSDNEGVEYFNMQFGGYKITYPKLVMNRLSWPLSVLKK